MSKEEYFKVETRKLDIENSSKFIFKANNKYLGIAEKNCKNHIQFFNAKKLPNIKEEYFFLDFIKYFLFFELNQKFQNVLLISTNNFVELYELPENFNKSSIELIPKIKYKINENIIHISFNPRYSHIIELLTENNLYIWDNKKFYNSFNLTFNSLLSKFKWERQGNLCGLCENKKINIINRTERRVIFQYNTNNYRYYEYEFLNEECIIIIFDNKIIKKIDLKENNEVDIGGNFKIYELLKTSEYFILNSQISLNIYDTDFKFVYKINSINLNNSIIISDSPEIKILDECNLNLITISENYSETEKFQEIEIKDNNKDKIGRQNINSFKLRFLFKKDLNREKYENKINDLNVKQENRNKNEENQINIKKDISEENAKTNENLIEEENEENRISFTDEEDDLNENYFKGCIYDLTNIINNLKFDINEDKSLPNQNVKKYLEIDYIKNSLSNQSKCLIDLKNFVQERMETKIAFNNINDEYLFYVDLLIKDDTNKILLKRYLTLLKNIDEKNIQLKYPHENFKNELNYYLPLFNKEELLEFNYNNYRDEKEEILELLINIKDSIKNKKFNEFKNNIESKNILFYQPFTLDSPEIIFLRYKRSIIEDIKNFKYKQNEENERLEYLNHIIETILDNKIFEKVKSPHKLIPLLNYINENEDKETYDFFFNLINFDENKENNLISNQFCLENVELNKTLSKQYDKSELYNYNYLINHPPLIIDIYKIKEFLKSVLNSNVFRELFEFLTGREDYKQIFSKNMINHIIDNIQFIPLNYTNTSVFFDKLTLTTYISTMKKTLFCNAQYIDNKIYETLENGIIIEIEFHEFDHTISAVLSYLTHRESLINTPRKKNIEFNKGVYYVELALFDKIIKTLTYEEALYILNLKNYDKTLDEFRNGFKMRKEKDLIINGPFENLNIKKDNIGNFEKNQYSISSRPGYKEFKNAQITIPFKNDIKGRDFNYENLLFYTTFHD